MAVKRQPRSAAFKFKVALEAVKEQKTVSQIASDYQVSPGQVSKWKKQLQSQGATVFQTKPDRDKQQQAQKGCAQKHHSWPGTLESVSSA